jgi:hypothetical protein
MREKPSHISLSISCARVSSVSSLIDVRGSMKSAAHVRFRPFIAHVGLTNHGIDASFVHEASAGENAIV